MSIEYKWNILNCDRKLPSEFINVAHWQCTGTDGDITSSIYATVSFEDGEINIPYESVTEADVLGWCWANGVDKEATEAAIASRIEELKAPKTASGTPWGE